MGIETKWTQGPWEFNYHDGSLVAGSNVIGYVEVKDWHRLGMGEANANLIAAAPELYEALAYLLQHNKELVAQGVGIDAYLMSSAYAALAKARGEL